MTNKDLRDLLMPAADQPMCERRVEQRQHDRVQRRDHHAVYCYLNEADRRTLRRARKKKVEDRTEEETRVYRLWRRLYVKMWRNGQDRDFRHNAAFRQWLAEQGHDPAAPHDQELYKQWLRKSKEQGSD